MIGAGDGADLPRATDDVAGETEGLDKASKPKPDASVSIPGRRMPIFRSGRDSKLLQAVLSSTPGTPMA